VRRSELWSAEEGTNAAGDDAERSDEEEWRYMIEEALFDAEEKMEKAVAVARDDLSSIRTGRANPGMFARVVVDYYGSPTPITQLSSVNVPEARMVVIKPYEASQLRAIEDAIRHSDLGVNPTNDGNIIRVSIPQLTEERRRDLVKQAKSKGEDAKVSVRSVRRRAMEELHRIRKDGEAGEDEVGRAEKDLDKATATYVGQIDELVKHKEGELLEV
jgi:ribosome recycling factor